METSGGEKGVLSGGVRVPEESKVLDGKLNRGDVISASERNSVESSDLRNNDRRDAGKNRSEVKVSRNDRWESWGVMNMVGRVLGGKLCMDDEVEDVDDYENDRVCRAVIGVRKPENRGEVNLVADVNTCQDVIGEPTPEDRDVVNQVADMNACQDVIGEPASEDRAEVNQVSDVNTCQDVIGERTSENRDVVNLAADADVNTCQDVIGEPDINGESANGIDIKGTDINSDSVKVDLGCTVEGNSFNGSQDSASLIVPDGKLELEEIIDGKADVLRPEGFWDTEEVNDVKADVLMPKECGEEDLLGNEIMPDVTLETEEVSDVKADELIPKKCGDETEKEGEYNVSDLVWGKVRGHPWWPGQIFSPSAASDKAKKYFRKESYLVAYFGDESFAWNEGSKLMPFRRHFSEMEKQSNADGFSHAVSCILDETARRVEFGLSCPCWSQEVRDEIKFQVIENVGIGEESSIIAGGDNVSCAARFSPGDFLHFVDLLAKHPKSEHDRLQFTIAKAQLQAYSRWKGYYELPAFEVKAGLLEDDSQLNVSREGKDSIEGTEGLLPCPVSDAANDISSKKRKSTAEKGYSRKRKQLSGDEEHLKIKEKFMSVLMSSGSSSAQNTDKKYVRRKSMKVDSSSKSTEMITSLNSNSSSKKQKIVAGVSEIDAKLPKNGGGESPIAESILVSILTPDMVLSNIILAAKMPLQRGQDAMIPVAGWLREFRNSICAEKSILADQEVDFGKHKEEQSSETADTLGFPGIKDSYWSDRIIQTCSRDQAMSETQNPYKGLQPETNAAVVTNLDENRESNDLVVKSDAEESRPTALILNFKNLDSIPSIQNLKEIFSHYGSLYESGTKILSKSKRAKVIFKRAADAETAFTSAGKYSIFGPSLISYRLQYTLKPRKSNEPSKKKKKKKGGEEEGGTAQNVDAV